MPIAEAFLLVLLWCSSPILITKYIIVCFNFTRCRALLTKGCLQLLQEAPFRAYFWETPSVTASTLKQPFEFIVQDSDLLANVRAEYSPFSGFLSQHENTNTVMSFPNLGRDATLVAPCKNGNPDDYASIATFARRAPQKQIHEFWRVAGRQGLKEIHRQRGSPVWISTSGAGVYWLHLRLDSYPKYYTYAPYRQRDV